MKLLIYFSIFTIIIIFACNQRIPQQTQVEEETTSKGIDTIVFFKPESIEEFVIIINHDTGQRDTMRVIDLD